MSKYNRGQRQTIVAWWIFRESEFLADLSTISPEKIKRWIEDAESDLDKYNNILTDEYTEYVPQ